MGRKNVIESFKMFDQADISTNATSTATSVIRQDQARIILNWTGTSPVGVITIEARNGADDPYKALDFGSAINISGNTGSHEIIFSEMPFTDLRVVYTSTSGTGNLDAIITSKVLGA